MRISKDFNDLICQRVSLKYYCSCMRYKYQIHLLGPLYVQFIVSSNSTILSKYIEIKIKEEICQMFTIRMILYWAKNENKLAKTTFLHFTKGKLNERLVKDLQLCSSEKMSSFIPINRFYLIDRSCKTFVEP